MIEEIIMDVIARHRRTLTSAKWEEGKGKKVQYLINPLTPELNPYEKACMPGIFTGDFKF
jgi:hypothetical protein